MQDQYTNNHHQLHSPEQTKIKIEQMLSNCKVKPQSLQQLPQSFTHFMKSRGLDINQLSIPIPRYIRLRPYANITMQQLAQDLAITTQEIVKIDQHFWAINPNAKINNCPLYKQGILYGMDYSSAMPVRCLDLCQGHRVLELCSAPGNKAMLMADCYEQITIKGVQISHNRANIMRSLISKYQLGHKIEVIEEDGLKYKSQSHFDRVLVDAECTHQGSLKHIFKFYNQVVDNHGNKDKQLTKQQRKQFKQNNSNPYTSQIAKPNQWSIQDFQQRFLDSFKLANLKNLQTGLLQNGFAHLKDGGILVYSTCSFDEQQNEEIIMSFIDRYPQAELMDATKGFQCSVGWKEGTLKGTIRFSPSISCCGGMFIGKIRKQQPK